MTSAAESILIESELPSPKRWRVWIAVLILALLLHLLAFVSKVQWTGPAAPAPVEIQQIDPQKLAEIQRRWNQQEKQLLLNKDQEAAKEAPKDAHFISDRNIHVEKEQRAKQTATLPTPGAIAPPIEQQKTEVKQQKAQKASSAAQELPKLGNLGVPFRIGEKAQESLENKERIEPQHMQRPQTNGGEQYIDDRRLVEGSENMLNAEESVYYSFYARLYQAIAPLWESRLREIIPSIRIQPNDYTTSADVVFDADGFLKEVRITQSSGVPAFDDAVTSSWKRIGRFPNPPSGLLKNGEVHTGWNFIVQVGGAGIQLMPPERTY